MNFDWSKPLAGAFGMALFAALILFGILIGLSLAVLTRAIAGETIIGLWGPALGAMIGASATIAAAIYNQHRTERREMRKHINASIRDMISIAARIYFCVGEIYRAVEIADRGDTPSLVETMNVLNDTRSLVLGWQASDALDANTRRIIAEGSLRALHAIDEARTSFREFNAEPTREATITSWHRAAGQMWEAGQVMNDVHSRLRELLD